MKSVFSVGSSDDKTDFLTFFAKLKLGRNKIIVYETANFNYNFLTSEWLFGTLKFTIKVCSLF
jgi:hypothetical protein